MKHFIILFSLLISCVAMHADNFKWALVTKTDGRAFHDGLAPMYKDGKYGYIDRTGTFAIEPQFKWADEFKDGTAKVKTETGEGLINTNGYYEIEPKYKSISLSREIAGLYYLTDSVGNTAMFLNHRIIGYRGKSDKDYKINLYDGTSSDFFKVFISSGYLPRLCKSKNFPYRYFDITGEPVDSSYLISSKGIVTYASESGKIGFMDKKTHRILTDTIYTTFMPLWINDRIVVCDLTDGKKSVVLDENAKEILRAASIEHQGTHFKGIKDWKEPNYFFTDLSGNIIRVPKDAYEINYVFGDWYCVDFLGKRKDVMFNIKTLQQYEGRAFPYDVSENVIAVHSDNENFYINCETGKKIPGNYKYINAFSEGLAVVWFKDNTRGVIDKSGKVLLREEKGHTGLRIKGDSFSEGVLSIEVYNDVFDHSYGYIYNPLGTDYVYNQPEALKKTTEIWFADGCKLLDKKKYNEAKDVFYKIMMTDPSHAPSINNYGYCLSKFGRYEEALEAYTMASDLYPEDETYKQNVIKTKRYIQQLAEYNEAKMAERESNSNSSGGSFWDALAAFGNAISQLGSSYSGYNPYQNFNSSSGYDNSSSSGNGGTYQQEYSRWESLAERHYNSLTNLGYSDRKKNHGSSGQGMSGGNYVQMKKSLRDAQREMRNIRNKARQNGINIPQSKWETVTVSY